ncbi:MAG: SMI1/KNR4 family protein, partial [Chloroflexota bacterium]
MDDYKRVFEKLRELATPYHLRARLHRPDEVDLAERELDVRFPKDYRFYLLNHSDITLPHYELAHVYADQRESRLSLFSLLSDMQKYHRVNDNLLPFVSDNGDYHCFEMFGTEPSQLSTHPQPTLQTCAMSFYCSNRVQKIELCLRVVQAFQNSDNHRYPRQKA